MNINVGAHFISPWVFMVGLPRLKYTGSLCLRVPSGWESGSRDPVNEWVA